MPRGDSSNGHGNPPTEPDPGATPPILVSAGDSLNTRIDRRTELLTRTSEVRQPRPHHTWPERRLMSAGGTKVSLVLGSPIPTTVSVYNLNGALVKTLADGLYGPGRYEMVWDGRDRAGHAAGAGVYFCRLRTPGRSEAQRLLLVR
jgi:hypothetical protein